MKKCHDTINNPGVKTWIESHPIQLYISQHFTTLHSLSSTLLKFVLNTFHPTTILTQIIPLSLFPYFCIFKHANRNPQLNNSDLMKRTGKQ